MPFEKQSQSTNDMEYSFKVDSDITQSVYNNAKNYLIEYDERYKDERSCAIYFSSNALYYPDNEETFRKRIIEKDFFEMYATRFKAHKHIYLRDVFKQWYLKGINRDIDSTEKLCEWLREETKGMKVYTVGSSAGGYAAVLFGSLLEADKVVAFNPQFEMESLLQRSNEEADPFIFRATQSGNSPMSKWFNICPYINPKVDIYYIYSNASRWDIE